MTNISLENPNMEITVYSARNSELSTADSSYHDPSDLMVEEDELISPSIDNCHFTGPTGSCRCSKSHSFVLQSPGSSFIHGERLLILDIDETILSSTGTRCGYSMWFGNTDIQSPNKSDTSHNTQHTVSRGNKSTDINIDGVWQYGFELFYLNQLNIASIVRPGFFETLDFALNHGFDVILYTRGVTRYGAAIHVALTGLYLKWQQLYRGIEITPNRIEDARNIFDMVIATNFAGKTLELIEDYIDLGRYDAIFILDDGHHHVWCQDYVPRLPIGTHLVLIEPLAFEPWDRIRSWLQVLRLNGDHAKDTFAFEIKEILSRDYFFESFREFLSLYVGDGDIQMSVVQANRLLMQYCNGWHFGVNQPVAWWRWNPNVRSKPPIPQPPASRDKISERIGLI